MPAYDIESPSNERIKRLVRLRDRRHRDDDGVFVVEGERLLSRGFAAAAEPLEVYYDPARFTPDTEQAVSVAPAALDRASYRSESEGVIAVFDQFDTSLDSLGLPDDPLVLMAEGIEKPGNLGAMLRTADAVGADAFVAVDSVVDVFNPNAVRASTGAIFSVPLGVGDLSSVKDWLDRSGVRLVAATPEGDLELWASDLTGSVALMIGAEAEGLSPAAESAAHESVRIPMLGAVNSLNASVALAVVAFEAKRQRSV